MPQLTEMQKDLFEKLHRSRQEDLKTFNKRDYKGIWGSIIDKYPESAHFVYELLQNADDAQATMVDIQLRQNALLFKHNGTKHFDVTEEDAPEVGDINSITAIGNSTKVDDQNKIGKFGVGFKAVFQYTDTPEIYDDTFKFRIDNYIVPTLLPSDHPERKEGETLFVIQFKDAASSFSDIRTKLRTLDNPILFLRNLEKIAIRIEGSEQGEGECAVYEKHLQETMEFTDKGIVMEKYLLRSPVLQRKMLLFTRWVNVDTNHRFPICIGYYYDEAQKKLITGGTQSIHCFFPTKETFKACFVSHAPFLLTDNRQNLKPNEPTNQYLVNQLSSLAADTLLCLRNYGQEIGCLLLDENIASIIPNYKPDNFGGYDPQFEQPMIDAFDKALTSWALLLSRDGEYLPIKKSYIGRPQELTVLLNKKQLSFLVGCQGVDFVKWELGIAVTNAKHWAFGDIQKMGAEDFVNSLTPEFMERQEKQWIIRMYKFFHNTAVILWKGNASRYNSLPVRSAPIVLTQRGEWTAPFADTTELNVFLPLKEDGESEYNFIASEYASDKDARSFFEALGIKEPDELDYIKNVILQRNYRSDSDFDVLIKHYQNLQNDKERDDFINLIKDKAPLRGKGGRWSDANVMYFQSEMLESYFALGTIAYLDLEYYESSVKLHGEKIVKAFASALGVSKYPRIKEMHDSGWSFSPNKEIEKFLGVGELQQWNVTDYRLEYFCWNGTSKEVSIYLWNEVLPALPYGRYGQMDIRYKKKYARWDHPYLHAYADSTFKKELRDKYWIYAKDGKLHNAQGITLEDLADEYNRNNGLIQFLGIEKREKTILELGGTEEQQATYELAKELKAVLGNDMSEEEALELLKSEVARKRTQQDISSPSLPQPQEDTIAERLEKRWDDKANKKPNRPHSSPTVPANGTFVSTTPSETPTNQGAFFDEGKTTAIGDCLGTDVSKTERNLKAKDTEAKEAAEKAREQVEIFDLLKQETPYTYLWFKLLMELMHSNKATSSTQQATIDFQEWHIDNSNDVLHLGNPSRPLPEWCCDADKLSVSIFSNEWKKLDASIINAKDGMLDLMVADDDKLHDTLQGAKKIRIEMERTSNITDSLEERFLQLGFEDGYDMNANLTKDIQFIYGPPGTGKTTRLVSMVHDIVDGQEGVNILILTPTNKAADVIAEKLVDDEVCYSWLARFGATENLSLAVDAAIVQNRDTMDMDLLSNNIVATTAARYAYDCLQPNDTYICDFPWDYIIMDEASMLDIVTATLILYKGEKTKFIISGDPMQIQPVTQNDIPAYNIYDMVGLHGFSDAIANYDRYPVITLTTQHRSTPVIGDLVSRFAYNGMVKADASRRPQKPCTLDGITVKDINFIGFDIVEFDLVKGIDAIGGSAFHLYAALFTYKMAEHVVSQLSMHYPSTSYSIGIVCPYRAEADAIKQMLLARPIDTDNCHVMSGTVHSFQGDECDIMFVVLNPPAVCTSGSHINKQNILNVAMSRARDYLFFVLPNGQTKGFTRKNDIGNIVSPANRTIQTCSEIEKTIFGDPDYIYKNTHVTCHMPVNVYCEKTSLFEVRIGNDALDITLNDFGV